MILSHFVDFTIGLCLMWLASGLVVKGIEKFSKDTKISVFATSFLILGVLTSLTEISVGLNAVLEHRPEIFVGNLIGGSFVIVMLIIPILAILNNGISFRHKLDQKRLLFFLFLITTPALVAVDGRVSNFDAVLIVGLYLLFFYLFQSREQILDRVTETRHGRAAATDVIGVIIGAVIIYISGKILVDKTVVIAEFLEVSPLLVSLMLLSVGTNLPEMMLAVRSIKNKHSEIAFGDYIGSAAMNAVLFGIFTLLHGSFLVETRGFIPLTLLIMIGYAMFFIFSRIKNRLSPAEGVILILIYIVFILFQTTEIISLSPVI